MQYVPNDRRDLRDGHGGIDGPVPALRRRGRQALRDAARRDPDAPAARRDRRYRHRIRIQVEHSTYLKRTLAERTAFHTGQTVEQIEADSDRDRWFTADEPRTMASSTG